MSLNTLLLQDMSFKSLEEGMQGQQVSEDTT